MILNYKQLKKEFYAKQKKLDAQKALIIIKTASLLAKTLKKINRGIYV